jgi:Raf kinase inhibitor-like YbhB/YbcL family protein
MKKSLFITLILCVGAVSMLHSNDQQKIFSLSSSGFVNQGRMSDLYACTEQGGNRSPELKWDSPPKRTKSFALVCNNLDASGGNFIHWIYYNIPSIVNRIAEGLNRNDRFPDGSTQGINSFNRLGYDGPCPSEGKENHYVFTLYALDSIPDLTAGANIQNLQKEMQGHILGHAYLIGLYQKPSDDDQIYPTAPNPPINNTKDQAPGSIPSSKYPYN